MPSHHSGASPPVKAPSSRPAPHPIPNPTDEQGPLACPNCGHHQVDEDGDCAECHEPGVGKVAGNTVLSTAEQKVLQKCEATIDRGRKAFVEVGSALMQIQAEKLYRASHGTFESYCKDKWDIGRAYAYRLIDASETMEVLSPIGDILPTAESHVRPLLQFPVEDRPAVWQDVVQKNTVEDDGNASAITAKHVKYVVKLGLAGVRDTEGKVCARQRRAINKQQREVRAKRWDEDLSSIKRHRTRQAELRRLDQIDSGAFQVLAEYFTEILAKSLQVDDLLRKIVPDDHYLFGESFFSEAEEKRSFIREELFCREQEGNPIDVESEPTLVEATA